MGIRVILFAVIVCTACQSGKIPCPEVKYASLKKSKVNKGNRFVSSPSRMMASTKGVEAQESSKRKVDLDRMRASRVTGKQMLDQYGTVDEWDCPSPAGKKKHSKAVKENIRRNEKKMREHLKHREGSDTITVASPVYNN